MLDPMGLYQIADSLAVELVPAVRERMQRIRCLTAIAVGALVTEGMEDNPRHRDASPYLVWEWLVVEAMVRTYGDDDALWGIPGTLVARRALHQHGYLDARSYLKTPRIFGFNGVYKRLAVHLGLIDVNLAPGPNAEELGNAWARGLGQRRLESLKPLLSRWRAAVARSSSSTPPRTNSGWGKHEWARLATAFAPFDCRTSEKRRLRDFLLTSDDRRLGALPQIWGLQSGIADDKFEEELLHDRLQKLEPSLEPLLEAIRSYEAFSRSLQDAFDLLLVDAAGPNGKGFLISDAALDADFVASVNGLHRRFASAQRRLGDLTSTPAVSLQQLFQQRFGAFADPLDPAACAFAICKHHETIQRAKSADGKRPWFDRVGPERICVRPQYRQQRREIQPQRYVHDYRGRPIRRFYQDLS